MYKANLFYTIYIRITEYAVSFLISLTFLLYSSFVDI